ncbi:hypothetical protein UT300012_32020 [Paraclostridium bifermentans]
MKKHKRKITIDRKELSEGNKILFDSFMRSLGGRKLKEATKYNYRKDIEDFIFYIDKDIKDITVQDLRDYLDKCKELGNGYARLERRYRIVQSFYKYTVSKKLLEKDITKMVKISNYK